MKHIVLHLQSDKGDLKVVKVLVNEMLQADSRNTQISNQFKMWQSFAHVLYGPLPCKWMVAIQPATFRCIQRIGHKRFQGSNLCHVVLGHGHHLQWSPMSSLSFNSWEICHLWNVSKGLWFANCSNCMTQPSHNSAMAHQCLQRSP